MIVEIIFILTAVYVITGFFKFCALILGNSIELPGIFYPLLTITPTHAFIWYPSLAFQVWFWSVHFGVF